MTASMSKLVSLQKKSLHQSMEYVNASLEISNVIEDELVSQNEQLSRIRSMNYVIDSKLTTAGNVVDDMHGGCFSCFKRKHKRKLGKSTVPIDHGNHMNSTNNVIPASSARDSSKMVTDSQLPSTETEIGVELNYIGNGVSQLKNAAILLSCELDESIELIDDISHQVDVNKQRINKIDGKLNNIK